MSKQNVLVRLLHEGEERFISLFHDVENTIETVRQKAFDLAAKRGFADGHELEDWLEAERCVCGAMRAKMTETEKGFEVKVEVAGYEPAELEVSATKDAIVVQGHTQHKEEKTEGTVHFSEFGAREFVRRIDYPAPVVLDGIKATVEKGVLTITADKAAVEEPNKAKKVLVAQA